MVGNVGIFLSIVGIAGFMITSKIILSESKNLISGKVIKYLESKYVVGNKFQEQAGMPTINLKEFLTLVPAMFLFVNFVGIVLITLTVFIYG